MTKDNRRNRADQSSVRRCASTLRFPPVLLALLLPCGLIAAGIAIRFLEAQKHQNGVDISLAVIAQEEPRSVGGPAVGRSGPVDVLEHSRPQLDLAETWFLSNIRDKGIFRYRYEVERDHYPNRNNELRQLMASRLLAELAAERPELIELHRRNLSFVFQYWYREADGIGYIEFDRKSKLGANAMALRTLAASPLADQYVHHSQALLAGILSLQNEDGSFRPWLKEPDYPYDADYLLTFYSGEAILALVDYHRATSDREALVAAIRAQDFYLQKYVAEIDVNYYPAYIPWHTQSLRGLYEITGDRRYADAALFLNDKLLELLDTEECVGRFYNPATPQYGSPHASSDAVYTESLAHAHAIARAVGDDSRAAKYLAAIELAVSNLGSLQYGPAESAAYGLQGKRMLGGIRTSVTNPDIRLDNVQHTIDAYQAITKALADTNL